MAGTRGLSLVGVLLAGTILLLLTLVVGASASAHLQMGTHQVNQHAAQDLAESAAARALREIVKDPTFGKPGVAGYSQVFRSQAPDDARAEGLATFDPAQAKLLHVPSSFNNFGKDVYDPSTGQVTHLDMDNNGNVLGGSYLRGMISQPPTETVLEARANGHTESVRIDFNSLINPADRLQVIQWRRFTG